LEAEILHHLRAVLRAIARLIVIRNTPVEFIEQVGTEAMAVRNIRALVLALILDAADGWQIIIPSARILERPGESSEEEIAIRETMVQARCPVFRGIERPCEQFAKILVLKNVRVSVIRQGIVKALNLLRHRVQSRRWNDVAGKRRIPVEWIFNNRAGQQIREVTIAPVRQQYRRIDEVVNSATARHLVGIEEERSVLAVVEPRYIHGTADREAGPVRDSGAARTRGRISRNEFRSLVIVEAGCVQIVAAGLRDDGHLSQAAELRTVIRYVYADLGHALHVSHQRRYLRAIAAVEIVMPSTEESDWLLRLPENRRVALEPAAWTTRLNRHDVGRWFGFVGSHSSSRPFPTSLDGVNVTVIDSAGEERPASLFLTLPRQISYIVPQGTAHRKGVALVLRGNQVTAALVPDIEPVAPGLLINARVIEGAAAAAVQRIKADSSQSIEPVTEAPIDLGPASDQVFLLLFGTGIRGRSGLSAVTATAGGQPLAVSYAGPQPDSPGLDQVNLLLPRSLIGLGQIEIALSMDG